jgi:heparan-alpha-glucosaminide N-acetyltransferase
MDGQGLDRRIESIDAGRGIAILLMLFVNDVAGIDGLPAWMKHVPRGVDGMTFVDLVFPAFLFIVGMSLPFAIRRRLERGDRMWQVWKHILIRTFGLLVIGAFMVNSDSISDKGVLNPLLWTLLMYAGIIFVWNTPPKVQESKQNIILKLRFAGVLLLLVLALLYQGDGMSGIFQMRPHWWGILGLIGWAYFVSCLIYIPLRRQIAGLVGAMAILYCIYLADEGGFLVSLAWIEPFIKVSYMLGSHSAIVLSGAILGMILTPESTVKGHKERMRWALIYGLGLASAGLLLHSLHDIHEMFIINKILGTPPWCLLSSAIFAWIWALLYWLIDVRGWKQWAVPLKSAGANALLAFILAPVFYTLFALLDTVFGGMNFYADLGNNFATGLLRAIAFAMVLTWLTGFLRRAGVWLRL